jgi:hypothetical protein
MEGREAASRRRFLFSGAVATAAAVLGARAQPAEAADGTALIIGTLNTGSSPTRLAVSGQVDAFRAAAHDGVGVTGRSTSLWAGVRGIGHPGVLGESNGAQGDFAGVLGIGGDGTGVQGESESWNGVYGTGSWGVYGDGIGPSGVGVEGHGYVGLSGTSTAGVPNVLVDDANPSFAVVPAGVRGGGAVGVVGYSGGWNGVDDPDYVGVLGLTPGHTGVYGASGNNPPVQVPSHTGVYGWSAGAGAGVSGRNDSELGIGVAGASKSGTGLSGVSTTGTGVRASVATNATGRALAVYGRAGFLGVSVATIAVGTDSTTVTPAVPIRTSSVVLATLQGDAGEGISMRYAAIIRPPRPAAPYVRVALTGNASTDVEVAYFVVEPVASRVTDSRDSKA